MRWLIFALAGCLSLTPSVDPAGAQDLKLQGDLYLEEEGWNGAFVGMSLLEGTFNSTGLRPDMDNPLVALSYAWFYDIAEADPGQMDGKAHRWSSTYVAGDTVRTLLTSTDGGISSIDSTGAEGPIGGLRDCPASTWRIGSDEALEAALADPGFHLDGQGVLWSMLVMGPQILEGCGAQGPAFWRFTYGPLADAFIGPTAMTVATVDAVDGTVEVAEELLRLRSAHEVVLFDDAYTPQATGGTQAIGEVGALSDSLSVQVTSAPVGFTTILHGPNTDQAFQGSITIDAPAPGMWSVEFSAGPAGIPSAANIKATSLQ